MTKALGDGMEWEVIPLYKHELDTVIEALYTAAHKERHAQSKHKVFKGLAKKIERQREKKLMAKARNEGLFLAQIPIDFPGDRA